MLIDHTNSEVLKLLADADVFLLSFMSHHTDRRTQIEEPKLDLEKKSVHKF